jgi:Methyltransferase domain
MSCSTTDFHNVLCPLCGAGAPCRFHVDARREYLRCTVCQLVFVPAKYHLTPELEKAEYDLHQNSPDDQGYRKFLSRLFKPMSECLNPGAVGMDFGCGPGPTLSVMFEEAGSKMSVYDLFYAPETEVLSKTYDFITCTEVVEHFASPGKEFERLFSMLKPSGVLGIMTKLVKNQQVFSSWHYIHDPTHISFFSEDTFLWIANHYKVKVEFIGNDVMILNNDSTLV